MADSTALDAVWPSPQIDASRITRPRSASRARSPLGSRAVGGQPVQRLLLADGADPARHALPARLVPEEGGDAQQERHQVDGVVEDHHHARAERRARGPRALERERQVELVGPDERAGRAAEQHGPQRAAVGHAAGQRQQLGQRGAERHLVHAGPLARGRTRRTAWARSSRRCRWPRTPGRPAQDRQHVDQGLDVVDQRGLAEQADLDRERRLVAGLAAEALDRVEDRGLLAADVGAGAAEQLDVERGRRCPSRRRRGSPGGGPRAMACSRRCRARGYSPRR